MRLSWIAVFYLSLLFIPNAIWTRHQPKGYTSAIENKWLVYVERIGQAAVVILSVIISAELQVGSSWLLALSFGCMVLYEGFWIRYFRSPSLQTFYGTMYHIPLPGASLPVLAFFLLSCYQRSLPLLFSVCMLAIGHLGIHIQHCQAHHISIWKQSKESSNSNE